MSWLYLVSAGLFEIGWPVRLKMAPSPDFRATGIAVAFFFMGISGAILWLAQRDIPNGKANMRVASSSLRIVEGAAAATSMLKSFGDK